jgi:hypothetical protein
MAECVLAKAADYARRRAPFDDPMGISVRAARSWTHIRHDTRGFLLVETGCEGCSHGMHRKRLIKSMPPPQHRWIGCR